MRRCVELRSVANLRSFSGPRRVLAVILLSLSCSGGIVSAETSGVSIVRVDVPMRDGIRLASDLYQKSPADSLPVLLMRTPYNRKNAKPAAERFAASGFHVLVQDCRGRFESEGDFIPYNNEGQDGFDTIEWIRRQPWCSGRIGMWGSSYVGATQWQAAAERPPGLVTMIPTATWSSFYRNLYLGGAVRLSLISSWAGGNSKRPDGVPVPTDWNGIFMHLPLSTTDQRIGWSIPWLTGTLVHPEPDGYWKRLDLTDDITTIRMPIMHVVGVYDFFSRESVDNFVLMQKQAEDLPTRSQQHLILGPWDHGTIGKSKVGERDFGPEAVWDATEENLQWFNRTLKSDSSVRLSALPAVRYFSMGENTWKESSTWPPEGSHEFSYYLQSAGHANSRKGDGKLLETAPKDDQVADQFRADPANPTPAYTVTSERPINASVWAPVDQSLIEDRDDVLVYTSEVLKSPLTFAGNPQAELFVSTDTPDADWVVRLTEVFPDGRSLNLAVGIQRGRYRNSLMTPETMQPGQVYRMLIDLGPVAAQFPAGHQLRVDISGAYYPLFDRNTNTGEGPFSSATRVATESVIHSGGHLSRLILPVMKN